ncbi:MAG: hypothetical protein KA778_03855 [Burkholderiaceae bacterium]|nr:hypothetical protein [Burkholderiaceae bacterium]
MDDELVLPLQKRAVAQYAINEEGERELRLFIADKEISFDEPELFAFGENLVRQSRFTAGAALGWAAGCDWPRVSGLLLDLIDEGVLVRADEADDDALKHEPGVRPSPLPAAPSSRPRSWNEGGVLIHELTGRPLELGYLELVVPVFRIAHASLDTEGRQVGESNVFPKALRVEVPTQWRACIYSGTRYQPQRPMNVSALKSMRAHWHPMMTMLRAIRAAYLNRFPAARSGWTVGHIERLATVVLSVPTYALMRVRDRVENGDLHPVLSSMFRVTDGVRMTMHQMMFVPIGEPTLAPDAPMTAAEVLAYAERNYSFHSEHGVCAGPQAMVEEFLRVLIDGETPTHADDAPLDPALARELACIDEAIDYGLRGLQAHSAVFSIWPAMGRAYEQLGVIAEGWQGARTPEVTSWIERMSGHLTVLRNSTYLASEAWRADREQVYADMYASCSEGLGFHLPADALPRLMAPWPDPMDRPPVERVVALLRDRLKLAVGQADSELLAIAQAVCDYLGRVRSAVTLAQALQIGVNARLGREHPVRPLEASDLDVYQRLLGPDAQRLPDLITEVEAALGLIVRITHAGVEINSRTDGLAAEADSHKESTGMVPAEPRA